MNFHAPQSIEEAVALLAGDLDARCLSGGQTLVAMMNADLIEPTALISLKRIAALRGITAAPDGWIRIGAMTTHDAIANAGAALSGSASIVRQAAARIAHPAIRSVGTIGGSLAHADPAADFPTATTAADAEIELVGAAGPRRVPARDFFVDYLQTALEPGELIAAIHLPPGPPGVATAYEKLSRVDGDFAIVSAAVVLALQDGRCTHLRLVAGGCGPTPIRSDDAEARLIGTTLGDREVADAAALFAQACDPVDDVRASGNYRRAVIARLLPRAVRTARDQLFSREAVA